MSGNECIRKRRRKGEGRESEERKKQRNSGMEYVSTSNNIIPAKQPPNKSVSCKCTYSCTVLSHDIKLQLFNGLYVIDHQKQQTYLLGFITVKHVQRRRHGTYHDPSKSRRQATVIYSLPDGNGDVVQVCKQTFREVFGLSAKRVQGLVELKKSGQSIYIEKRGNKSQCRKFNATDKKHVCDHINTFPREVSHYGRMKTAKEYFSPDLNINRLYQSFRNKYPDTHITYRYFYLVFKKEFPNISFHSPRSDTCGICDRLAAEIAASVGEVRKTSQTQQKLHHLKAKRARDVMKDDFAFAQLPSGNRCVMSMDLQQVLFLPTLTHSQMFYSRQLANYNLCTHFHNGVSVMNLWHEGLSGRGANEMGSCVFKAVGSMDATKDGLIVWSDNCCGQNKNKIILFLWIYFTCIGIYKEVDHKFLVTGHSFLDCDRDFAHIEKRKRISKCYVPDDLKSMIEHTREKNPFVVNVMDEDNFFNFKEAANQFLVTTKLNISKAQWIRVTSDRPGVVQIKQTFSEVEHWRDHYIFRKGVTAEDIATAPLPVLQCSSKLSEEKKKDLKHMIPFLPSLEHKRFYEDLTK